MTDRYVGIRPDVLDDIAEEHSLRLDARAVLTHLLMLVDHRTGEANYTLGALADRMGAHPVTLRKVLNQLSGKGLVTFRFPKGHMGTISVPPYPQLVHLSRSQREGFALRNATTVRYDDGAATVVPGPTTRRDRVTSAKGSRCDQDPLSGVFSPALGEAPAARDPVSPLLRKPDAPHPQDEVLEGEEIPIESSPSLGSTPGRGRAQVTTHNEQQSPGFHTASSSMSCGTNGGGSDPTPVHPRSRNDTAKAIAAHMPDERDARATDTPEVETRGVA